MKTVLRLVLVGVLVVAGIFLFRHLAKPPDSVGVEKFIPADAMVYVHYQGLDKAALAFEGTSLKDLLNEQEVLEFRDELSRFLADLVEQNAPDFPLDWEDIRLLYDCEAAFAVFDASASDVELALIVDPGRHVRQVRRIVDDLIKEAGDSGATVTDGELGGVDFTDVDGAAVAWVKGALVVTSTQDTFEKVLKTRDGEAPSITADKQLQAMRAKTMGDKEFFMAHLRADRGMDLLKREGLTATADRRKLTDSGLDSLKCVHLNVVPDAPGIRAFVYLHTPDGPKGVWRMLPAKPIDEAKMLAEVPSVATTAILLRWSPPQAWDALVDLVAALGEKKSFDEGVASLNSILGFDLRNDLLAVLGDEIIFESSPPSTPGIAVLKVTVKVTDEAKAQACIEKIVQTASGATVAIQKLDHKGTPVFMVTFPGTFVPVQPTFAVGNGRLIVGTSMPLVTAALDAAGPPARSLAAKGDFIDQRARLPEDASMVSYAEIKRSVATTYPAMQAGLSTLMSMAGPSIPENRLVEKLPDVSVITPHLFGSVGTLRWDGEGFMLESYGPLGGAMNPGGAGTVAVGGIAAGFMLPAFAKAKESAHRAHCLNNLRQIGLAMKQYAVDNDDKYPDSFAALLKEGYLNTAKVFICPSSGRAIPDDFPADFKTADLADLKKIDELSDYVMVKGVTASSPADFILIHEKDGAHGGDGRNCGHVDCHVRWYTEFEFQRMLREQRQRMSERNK